jgi:hypothetical protein
MKGEAGAADTDAMAVPAEISGVKKKSPQPQADKKDERAEGAS